MTIKHAKTLAVIYLISSVVLIGAILNTSFFKREKYTNLAVSQRTEEKIERCIITDRNLIPLTGDIASDKRLACHLIGYADSSGVGVCGVEKALDEEIRYLGSKNERFLKDARGNAISSFKSSENQGDSKSYVKLTIDYHIQQITENALDKYGITGAVVILDAENFDVISMASRPNFDSDNIETYVDSSGTELLNRAVSQYNAGSIFKIVTMAGALENGICPKSFLCTGSMTFDSLDFPCHTQKGHGHLLPDEAFALSCNCSFYQLGTLMGSDEICRFAQKFGLGESVLGGVIPENTGNIPAFLANTESEEANLSIGQGEIMITPLQGAKLACIIASGGISKNVNIIDGIVSQNGNMKKEMKSVDSKRVISESTAKAIGDMMRKSVESGTGTNAKSQYVAIAGKTGSAETGWKLSGNLMVQGWFIGYFPYENPKYAIAVMVENGRGGNIACAPIFREIAEEVTLIGK